MASAGTITFDTFSSNATEVTLENSKTITPTDDGVTVLLKLNLDATAQPQVDEITINSTLPGADAYYLVTIDDYTANAAQTFTYFYDTASADTAPMIAARLAALINAAITNRPEVSAKVQSSPNDNKINVSSLLPGTNGAFTLTVSCLNASDNTAASGTPITKTSTAGTGTGKLRSIVQFTVEMVATESSANSMSYPELNLSGTWYNGEDPAVTQSTISTSQFTGPLPFDTLLTVD